MTDQPGTRFSYSNKAVNLLSGMVQKVSGKALDTYTRDDLFANLGITDFNWDRDSSGNPYAYARLQLRPEDLAKLGQLVLNRGMWNGEQLIKPEWFDEMWRGSTQNPRYGLLWMLVPERTTYIIDDGQIQALEAAGVDTAFVRKAATLLGRYASRADFFAALEKTFGSTWYQVIRATLSRSGVQLERVEHGPSVGYLAQGYLGQYLVIYPDEKIVAVRMIRQSNTYNASSDSFDEFPQLVRLLVR